MDVVRVAVRDIKTGFSPRRGVDPRHVQMLTEAAGAWPPILLHHATMTVIDGAHRLTAAKRLGLVEVEVMLFPGSEDDARIEAVRANVAHGLPLTLAERKRAASHVLRTHFSWSDRQIAAICGLSPKTIARVRQADVQSRSSDEAVSDLMREGRDGRVRPTSPTKLRARIVEALRETPEASLRAVAARTGASPETVRHVRAQLLHGPSLAPGPAGSTPPRAQWNGDASLASTPSGVAFTDWFERHDVSSGEAIGHAEAVPLSRIYEIIDEIERRRAVWDEFVAALRFRIRRP